MSLFAADSLTPSGGGTQRALPRGVAAAWVNWDGTTTTIADDENVSSVIKDGTGLFTVNYTNVMTNASYAALTQGDQNDSGSQNICTSALQGSITASSIGTVSQLALTGANLDRPLMCLTTFGDLA